MNMYELYKKNKKNAGQNGFRVNQINKLTVKLYSNLRNISIFYYINFQIQCVIDNFFEKHPKTEKM